MAKKKIFAIGFDLPGVEGFEVFDITSDQSLLDADVIVFRPNLSEFEWDFGHNYAGQRVLTQRSSFEVKEKIGHWSAQMKAAFDVGKTVIVFLPPKEQALRYTGEETHAGTARSRVTTRTVGNYPVDIPRTICRMAPSTR